MPRDDVRPTAERARQAYFNIISERIEGARFLDLFAGSGIFALEALSRGASAATAVDLSRQNAAAISKQAQTLGIDVEMIASDVLKALSSLAGRPFDIVYADPPYDYTSYDELLLGIDRLALPDNALVTIEHRRRTEPFTAEPENLKKLRRAEYGEVWMTFFSALPQL